MSQKKVQGSSSLQSIKSLPVDFLSMGTDSVLENVERLSDAEIGSVNEESSYCSLDLSTKDGASLRDDGDNIQTVNTTTRSFEQLHADSKWSGTTSYASKKVYTYRSFPFLVTYLHIWSSSPKLDRIPHFLFLFQYCFSCLFVTFISVLPRTCFFSSCHVLIS